MFNWKLYDTFISACEKRDLKITYTHGTCTVGRGEFPYYIILWTPMNKMPMWEKIEKKERLGDSDFWKHELEDIRDNVTDFHVEFAGTGLDDSLHFSTVGWWKYTRSIHQDPTVEKWLEIFDLFNNRKFIQSEYFLWKLQVDPDEEVA